MDLTPEQQLNRLLDAYSHAYDVERDVTVEDTVYPAMATYFLRDENYLISRKHVLSAMEQHEYVYFLQTEHLSAEDLQKLAGSISPEAKKLLKRTRFRKYYMLGLQGWTEYQLAAMETSTKSFYSNPAGVGARKNLERNFRPRKK